MRVALPPVALNVPPHRGTLLEAWGTTPDGQWWALVVWESYVARGLEQPRLVRCSGWASSRAVSPIAGQDYSGAPLVRLDADRHWWPRPVSAEALHFGVLTPDRSLDAPTGMRWCYPRRSRRDRLPRYEQATPRDRH